MHKGTYIGYKMRADTKRHKDFNNLSENQVGPRVSRKFERIQRDLQASFFWNLLREKSPHGKPWILPFVSSGIRETYILHPLQHNMEDDMSAARSFLCTGKHEGDSRRNSQRCSLSNIQSCLHVSTSSKEKAEMFI